eukprot:CAMPEP_0177340816 /NCGR_PEP_ID=MMETSP0368-20130122/26159_1 /TAXON_ID=447022 ORGANISM="Scrippsiella hangoei-like, Strain SHHI-4" /NCGR_SAMPLE_ID=MMETSP0368 /ASSEMBLY_ACC=CAM_ASM_000363 /LENGTH=208 /DNA_ID=CAMNT_0018802037 /DNA_START=91 /DNA_END=714 /DNA_ORIENTATION=+
MAAGVLAQDGIASPASASIAPDPYSADGMPPPAPPMRVRGTAAAELLAATGGRPCPALLRPLPSVGGHDNGWNTQRCHDGRKCADRACKFYHSDHEKRCEVFARSRVCQGQNCGLHVGLHELNGSLEVDLSSSVDVCSTIQDLSAKTQHERAKVVRIVVYGFEALRATALKRILGQLPLLHELVLPDRVRELNVAVFLCDIMEEDLPL